MHPREIAQRLKDQFSDDVTASLPDTKHPRVHVMAKNWRNIAQFLRNDPAMQFDWLSCLSALDYVSDNLLCGVYDLYSTTQRHWFAVKVFTDRNDPHIPTVMDIWPASNWHEREAFDLMGIIFDGHNDLRRILLPEDWVGHPLRKDYVFPREYHGIPGTTELDWQQQSDYPV